MAAKPKVEFIISARDMTRAAFRRIRRSIGSLRTSLVGLAAGLGLGTLIDRIFKGAVRLEAASSRLQISVEDMQRLETVAEGTGASFEQLVIFLQRISRNADAAVDGNTELWNIFKRLGFTMSDLRRGRNDPVFMLERIAEISAEAGVDFGSLRSELQRVGDDIGPLIPLLRLGPAEIQRRMGRVATISAEANAALAEQQRRNMENLDEAFRLAMITLATVMPDLIRGIAAMTEHLAKIPDLVEDAEEDVANAQRERGPAPTASTFSPGSVVGRPQSNVEDPLGLRDLWRRIEVNTRDSGSAKLGE